MEKQAAAKIQLADPDAEIEPVPTSSGGHKPEPELDRLWNILKTFNDQFGNIPWTDADRVHKLITEDISDRVAADTAYQNAKKNSDRQNARIEHDKALARVMTAVLKDDTELLKQFVDNESFRRWLTDTVFGLTYESSGATPAGREGWVRSRRARRGGPPSANFKDAQHPEGGVEPARGLALIVIPRAHTVRRRLLRGVALLFLIAYGASAAEAVVGAVRDGRVHHESSAAAAVHQTTHHGEHGHEDPGAGAEHDADHQHGTSGDHCTHAHGVSLPTFCDFDVVASLLATPPITSAPAPVDRPPTSHFRPPRA